ncbi:hypothetical protein SERLA73DRAFT_179400 [Serpula lacrymans var. lacrymans S7.3]|uniref:Uncharacterized protein n=1 Tax=Serpula lacrymans var. lacrymans (strain S7.3) TaxID=936435 RepID=F8PS79_SERL3|nr:hypothetical protein SERLA73DRAFT_179400 [Serpula lacrymans var. lacrymans S7.3]
MIVDKGFDDFTCSIELKVMHDYNASELMALRSHANHSFVGSRVAKAYMVAREMVAEDQKEADATHHSEYLRRSTSNGMPCSSLCRCTASSGQRIYKVSTTEIQCIA